MNRPPIKIALCIPGLGTVPAVFAHDLARITGHVASTYPNVNVRLLAAAEEEPSPEVRDALVNAAQEWGADICIFPNPDNRMPADAFDPLIEELARKRIILPGEVH